MRFLAILKDSIREAIDTKVFYVTLGLSTFLLILVASVSFRPLTVEDEAQQTAQLFNMITKGFGGRGGNAADFQIEHFQRTGSEVEPWKGSYQFDFVARLPEGAQHGKDPGDGLGKEQLKRVLEQRFYRHKIVELDAADTTDPRAVRFPVRIEGSKIDKARDWDYEPSILFSIPLPMPFFATSTSGAVYWIEDRLVNRYGGWIGVLAGVVITAFFIPNMLRKGTIDLLLAKPVRRWTLLLYKYVGGLSFVFLNTVFVVGGLWIVLGLRTGIWAPGFLISILGITFFFAILYSVSTFFALITRSPIVAILMTVVVWGFLSLIGYLHQFIDERRAAESRPEIALSEPISTRWWAKTIDAVHFVLPRTNDLDVLTTQFISHSLLEEPERKSRGITDPATLNWVESITVSVVFIALLLGLSCWRFTVKDY
jgi:ABC-type transport system involved in multi-copper enzyme maturation permease subunit